MIRESAKLTQAHIRWVSTRHMHVADRLTKDALEPIEFLRVCLKESIYHIHPATVVLQKQALEKERNE